jgi:tRNA pseudouridine55 synthase
MNGILLINKESGLTSNAVIQKIKRILKVKKIGHAGTLDPLATGLLVVLINQATKLSDYLLNEEKEYLAEITLGVATDTEDSTGKIIQEKELKEIGNIDLVLESLIGKQKQVPPMYSAIKRDGRKLYELAREGLDISRPEREIEIKHIKRIGSLLKKDKKAYFSFQTIVSKGTYIRTLCTEIGSRLGYPAHLSALERIKSGNFSIEDAFTLADIEMGKYRLISPLEAMKDYHQIEVNSLLKKKVLNGVPIESKLLNSNEEIIIFSEKGEMLGIYQFKEGKYRAQRIWN